MEKPLFKDFASCDTVDEFFSQFVYKPSSSRCSPSRLLRKQEAMMTMKTTVSATTSNSKLKSRKKTSCSNRCKNKDKTQKDKEDEKKKKRKSRPKSACLTAEQRRSEPYRRVPKDHPWVPPVSPYRLIQEFYYHDAWKILVICLLCNRTRGAQAQKVLEELFLLCPSAEATANVPVEMIEEKIRYLGFHRKRSLAIKRLSMEYLEDWVYVTDLYSVGKYAADAYAIFCSGHWKEVNPVDHRLVDYWKFLHQEDERTSSYLNLTTEV